MSTVAALLESIRRDLSPTDEQLRQHPYLEALENGHIPQDALRRLAGEQHAIITSDLRSVALLVNRFGDTPAGGFLLGVLQGERLALAALAPFARALGMDDAALQAYEPLPGAHAYTAYMAWLALYASAAEVAAAYLVNFPAWGESCGRVSRSLQTRYGLRREDTAFFDFFAAPNPEFQEGATDVIAYGLAQGVAPHLIRRAARLLQGYERLFWDTLLAASVKTSQRDTAAAPH
jgi:thiaminase